MDTAALQVHLLAIELEAAVGGEGDRPDTERQDLGRPLTEGSISCGRAAFYQGI
jgi:hypothetical protein